MTTLPDDLRVLSDWLAERGEDGFAEISRQAASEIERLTKKNAELTRFLETLERYSIIGRQDESPNPLPHEYSAFPYNPPSSATPLHPYGRYFADRIDREAALHRLSVAANTPYRTIEQACRRIGLSSIEHIYHEITAGRKTWADYEYLCNRHPRDPSQPAAG